MPGTLQNGKWIAADAINETHLDLGSGTNQINADTFADGATNIIPTSTQETNWDNHLGATNNPHGVTASQAGAIANSNDAVKDTHIDWGTSENQVSAVDMPIADANSNFTAENVEAALAEFAEQYIALQVLVSNFTADEGYDDVDTVIDAAAVVDTARANFTSGKGVFVDASGTYGEGGGTLPAGGAQVTELGLAGTVTIRDHTTKDVVSDGAGNEVYGVLFWNTTDSKFYLKYFSDVDDTQTAYTAFDNKAIDFYFAEIFQLKGLDPTAIIRGGVARGVDLATATAASGVSIADTNGDYTATTVEGALAEIMDVIAKATLSSGDITAGWKSFATKAHGAAGEKTSVQLTPKGGPVQEYAVDYTCMNTDNNDALILIWKASGVVTGIASPTYPSAGLVGQLAENDVVILKYSK